MSGTQSRQRILFVTGQLAEPAVRRVVAETSRSAGFDYEIAVLNVTVAALLTTKLVARRLTVSGRFDRAILPGWCNGALEMLGLRFGFPFELGPREIEDLPTFFGADRRSPPSLREFSLEILAEINHAPRASPTDLLAEANRLRADGADVIDLGCEPGSVWDRVAEAVRMLRGEGHRVSIDSFERAEVEAAVAAGAELVLSVNSSNLAWAADLPAELVAIPDDPRDLDSLGRVIDGLRDRGAKFRIDPILEPLGVGLANSLVRYADTRRRWPDVPVLMGVGNVTELTAADSAGLNLLLAGVCEELGIRSVLTTQVINWCRTSVRELDLARRIMHAAAERGVPPKHLSHEVVMLRDPRLPSRTVEELDNLFRSLKDPNFRVFAEAGQIHLMNRDGHWRGTAPAAIFSAAVADGQRITPEHAFYLGEELSKASLALALGKRYVQDEPLRWGFLTPSPPSHHAPHRHTEPAGTAAASRADEAP